MWPRKTSYIIDCQLPHYYSRLPYVWDDFPRGIMFDISLTIYTLTQVRRTVVLNRNKTCHIYPRTIHCIVFWWSKLSFKKYIRQVLHGHWLKIGKTKWTSNRWHSDLRVHYRVSVFIPFVLNYLEKNKKINFILSHKSIEALFTLRN